MKRACFVLGVALFLPVAALAADEPAVTVEKDLAYLGPGRTETLDLYRPTQPAQPGERRPGIVIIHGGGWTGGDKGAKREINIGTTLARHGYVCVSINYALARPDHPTWPGNLHDCKRAVRWLRRNADRYAIDPDHLGAIGGSAGGHLTAMLAVTGPGDGLDPVEDADLSARVQAAVPLYPHMAASMDGQPAMLPGPREKFSDAYRAATPISHVTKDDSPLLILHGTADKTTPLSQSERFARRLAEVGLPHQLVIIEGAAHSFDLQPRQRDLRPLVVGFFDRHLKPARAGESSPR